MLKNYAFQSYTVYHLIVWRKFLFQFDSYKIVSVYIFSIPRPKNFNNLNAGSQKLANCGKNRSSGTFGLFFINRNLLRHHLTAISKRNQLKV